MVAAYVMRSRRRISPYVRLSSENVRFVSYVFVKRPNDFKYATDDAYKSRVLFVLLMGTFFLKNVNRAKNRCQQTDIVKFSP